MSTLEVERLREVLVKARTLLARIDASPIVAGIDGDEHLRRAIAAYDASTLDDTGAGDAERRQATRIVETARRLHASAETEAVGDGWRELSVDEPAWIAFCDALREPVLDADGGDDADDGYRCGDSLCQGCEAKAREEHTS